MHTTDAPYSNIVRLLGVLRIPHDAVRRVLREEAPGSMMLSPNGGRPPSRVPRKAWALLLEYACDGPAARLVAQQMAFPHTRLYSDDDALAWAEGAAAALAHLHALSPAIIHRHVNISPHHDHYSYYNGSLLIYYCNYNGSLLIYYCILLYM